MDWRTRWRVYAAAARNKLRRMAKDEIDPYTARPDGVCLSPSEGLLAEGAPRRLAYDPENLGAWQVKARDALAQMTGYLPAEEPVRVVVAGDSVPVPFAIGQSAGPAIRRTTYYLRVRKSTDIPVTVLAAENIVEPAPVFLFLAGSTSGVHVGWGEAKLPIDHQRIAIGADFARQAARRGYLAVCIEQLGFGERGERDIASKPADRNADPAGHALLLGRSLQGLKAMDVSAVIDWLCGSGAPYAIDRDRLFLLGHSLGGTAAQFAAALDSRIRGVLASGSVRRILEVAATRGVGNGEYSIPGFLEAFETDDLLALIAPRPFVGLSGRADHIFPYDGVARVVEGASAAYAAFGAADRISAVAAPAGHQYYSAECWAAWQSVIDPLCADDPMT